MVALGRAVGQEPALFGTVGLCGQRLGQRISGRFRAVVDPVDSTHWTAIEATQSTTYRSTFKAADRSALETANKAAHWTAIEATHRPAVETTKCTTDGGSF